MPSCNNDNEMFTRFCIERVDCDYNIYSSLDLKEEIFDHLPDSEVDSPSRG